MQTDRTAIPSISLSKPSILISTHGRGGLLLFSLEVLVFIGIQECFAVSIDEKKQT